MPRHRVERDLVHLLRGRRAVAAAALREALGISPATLAREVRAAGSRVLRLGAGRATHYGLPARYEGLGNRLPVFRIDPGGEAQPVGELVPLDGGSCWLERVGGRGVAFDGLPPFVHDMAPSGFLGRRSSRRHADLVLPDRLQDWNDRHRLLAVTRRGADCPGDLVVGEEAMDRYLSTSQVVVGTDEYPQLAEQAGLGGASSSAAGEQPKFTCFDGEHHLIVKFTPGDGSATDTRWRDLLVCEAIASEVLREHGVASARANVVEVGARRYLRVERFDRTRAGRVGVLTLGAVDDEYFGYRDDWSSAAQRLRDARMLGAAEVRRVKLVETFADMIGNGDRHFGNLGLLCDALDPRAGCRLAPVYDMLPMNLAPSAGVVPKPTFRQGRRSARNLDVFEEAAALAAEFRARVGRDERVSVGMRAAARDQRW